jgi:hypothetical protein
MQDAIEKNAADEQSEEEVSPTIKNKQALGKRKKSMNEPQVESKRSSPRIKI